MIVSRYNDRLRQTHPQVSYFSSPLNKIKIKKMIKIYNYSTPKNV